MRRKSHSTEENAGLREQNSNIAQSFRTSAVKGNILRMEQKLGYSVQATEKT